MRKGQASIEFLVFVLLAIFFLLASALFYAEKINETVKLSKYYRMREICSEISSLSSLVYAGGNGTNVSEQFPKYIYGDNYSIYINGNKKYIRIIKNNKVVGCLLSVPVSNGTSQLFNISSTFTIANINGGVVFE